PFQMVANDSLFADFSCKIVGKENRLTHRKPLQTAADYFQSDLRYLSARDSLEMQ
ncbi:hypothetical protein AHY37_003206, partial [Salmonella enterica subsp. enterica]|nr:hypothetical protein [Salmonella enterica subsp. enterica serovar Javiana]